MAVTCEFDPFSEGVIADPYRAYADLHAGPRVLRQVAQDFWVLSRYEDVRSALRDHVRFSSADGVMYVRAPIPMMLTMDPPDHERLRKIVGREFAPRDVHRFRPDVERFVREGLDEVRAGVDLVEAVAMPVPIRLMAAILGVPEDDIPQLRQMSDDLVKAFSIVPSDDPTITAMPGFDLARVNQAALDIHGYFTVLIGERRKQPADDLVTKLIQPTADGALSEWELLWFCLLLLVAGIETTTNLIGNMVIALAEHPDQWELLREQPDSAGAAVSESLRYDAPIQGFFRTTLEAVSVADTEIPSGSRVLLSFGAANRDPTHYSDPDDFRIDRSPEPTDHLAFGSGIHRCLGAGLAELEGRIVLEQLLEGTKTLEIDGDVVRTMNPTLRGATRLPLRLNP